MRSTKKPESAGNITLLRHALPSLNKGTHACWRAKGRLTAFSTVIGQQPDHDHAALPSALLFRQQIRQVDRPGKRAAGKAEKAAGLSPCNKDNAVCSLFLCRSTVFCLV